MEGLGLKKKVRHRSVLSLIIRLFELNLICSLNQCALGPSTRGLKPQMTDVGIFLSFNAVAAVAAAPKFHAPPKVPIKPSAEDLEVYGSVYNTHNIECVHSNLVLHLVFMFISCSIGQAQ